MLMGHKIFRQCSQIWLEDVCKVLRHDSYCSGLLRLPWCGAHYRLTICWQIVTNLLPVIVNILTLNLSFKHENCSHASVEGAPTVSGHAFISPLGLGQAADTIV
jgi:hypothetical protein